MCCPVVLNCLVCAPSPLWDWWELPHHHSKNKAVEDVCIYPVSSMMQPSQASGHLQSPAYKRIKQFRVRGVWLSINQGENNRGPSQLWQFTLLYILQRWCLFLVAEMWNWPWIMDQDSLHHQSHRPLSTGRNALTPLPSPRTSPHLEQVTNHLMEKPNYHRQPLDRDTNVQLSFNKAALTRLPNYCAPASIVSTLVLCSPWLIQLS